MKTENWILFAIAGIFSSVAIAGTSSTPPHNKSGVTTSEMPQALTLEEAIQRNTEKKLAAETKKYSQIAAIAGNRQDELEKSKNEVNNTYKIWHDLKSAVEESRNANPENFKAIEAAALAYSRANREFIELQKDILAKNGVSSDTANNLIVINRVPSDQMDTFNTAPATAAGSRKTSK